MTSLNGTTDGFNSGHPRRLYITTSAYHNDIYKYTTSRSTTTYLVSGTLTSLATLGTGTAANCPADRILRENGRRLNKDANPGVSTLLVGVYDSVSGLSGFIDPNSPRFAVYNGDKSVFQDNGVDPNGGLVDRGPPIFTRGTVTAGSGLTVTSGGATITDGGLTVNGGNVVEKIASSTITIPGANAAWAINLTLGNIFNVTAVTNSTAATISGGSAGTIFHLVVTSGAAATFVLPSNVACDQYSGAANNVVLGAATTKILLTCIQLT